MSAASALAARGAVAHTRVTQKVRFFTSTSTRSRAAMDRTTARGTVDAKARRHRRVERGEDGARAIARAGDGRAGGRGTEGNFMRVFAAVVIPRAVVARPKTPMDARRRRRVVLSPLRHRAWAFATTRGLEGGDEG